MPALICQGCGQQTNTAVSNAYSEPPYGIATKCFAACVDGQWVKGCSKEESIIVNDFIKRSKKKK